MPHPICDSCDEIITGDFSYWLESGVGKECSKGTKYPLKRFKLSKEERKCLKRLTTHISEKINDYAFVSGFSERNIDGVLMNKIQTLTGSINKCLREQPPHQPLIQIRNLTFTLKEPIENIHGGDWIIIIEYYFKDGESEKKYKLKLIPIQAKREYNKKFQSLVAGEFPKDGKPQSEKMINELAENSFFIFYSEEEDVITIPAKSIYKKTKKFKEKSKGYPTKWSQLNKFRGKRTFHDFFINCLESKCGYGEVDPSKIESIGEYVKKRYNIIEIINDLIY